MITIYVLRAFGGVLIISFATTMAPETFNATLPNTSFNATLPSSSFNATLP